MNRSIIPVLAILGCAVAPVLAQDMPPTAPLGLRMTSATDETVILDWLESFGDSATSGNPPTLDGALGLAAAVGPAGLGGAPAGAFDDLTRLDGSTGGTGTPASGFCHHYILRMSPSPITTQEPGTILSSSILSKKSGTPEVTRENPYTVTGLSPNTTYYFSVQAVDDGGKLSSVSILSAGAATTLDPQAPGAVSDLTVTDIEVNSAMIRWTAPCDDGVNPASGPVVSYTIRRWLVSDPSASFTSNFTTIAAPVPADPGLPNPVHVVALTGLDDGETYAVGILSNDGSNDSPLATTFVTTAVYVSQLADNGVSGSGCSSTGSAAMALGAAAVLALALARKA